MNNLFLILGIIGLIASGVLIWWYYRVKTKESEDVVHHSEHYFDEELITAKPETAEKSEPLLEPPLLDETVEESSEKETTDEPEAETIKNKELFIVLYVMAQQEPGFTGTDVFSVLKEQGLSYGKMKIFHHHGIGELKVKDSIFSIANIVEPGTFDPREMEKFTTSGLVLFLRLPGPFGGRVAFELMLNTAQRIAEMLEGVVKDERHQPLSPESIEIVRERISEFEKS